MDHHPHHQLLNNNGPLPRNSSFHQTPPSNLDRQSHDRHPLFHRASLHLPHRQTIQAAHRPLHNHNKKNLHSGTKYSVLSTQMEFLASNRSSNSLRSFLILICWLDPQRHDKSIKTPSILITNQKRKMIVVSVFHSPKLQFIKT